MYNQKDNIESIVKSLNERKKELECIYKIDFVLKDFDNDLKSVLLQIVDIVPIGWRYSDICKIKISVYDVEAASKDFKKSELKLSAPLFVDEIQVGELMLCYIKPVRAEKGVFLEEENRLFQTIVEKINQYLSFRKLKEQYSESIENKLKHNNHESGFSEYLKKLHLSNEEIDIITKVPIEFRKGETICKQGSFASFVMIHKEGLVKAFIENSHYKNHVFKITKPFNIIGLSSLYGDNYYHFSCQALMPSKIYLVERNNFDLIIRSNPQFSIEIMKMYSNSLQNVYDKLGSIANKQALGRVCDTLIYLSEKVFESNIIETSVTRKDIAEFSGLATENLVRILSDLKKDNIISINNKVIEILNPDTLKMLSNLG
ncbi:MAG: Crp/Fnr family transcriptional regulator [Bacteroidales bacterium]|jgi:CRP/FNR family transcriptional regulator|nr:Crp/Fnr family transcriptional regulator [Bacteroidales bacterium]